MAQRHAIARPGNLKIQTKVHGKWQAYAGGLGSAATRDAEDILTDGDKLPDGRAIKIYGDTHWGEEGGLYPDYNEADQGVTGDGRSAKSYIDIIASNHATLIFRHNSGLATTTYIFSTHETIPSNINVVIEQGAILSVATSVTLTIEGRLVNVGDKAFAVTGTGAFIIKNNNVEAHWFDGTDIWAQVNLANVSLYRGGEILVRPGDYAASTQVTLYGGRSLTTKNIGWNTDLDYSGVAACRVTYSGISPMITLTVKAGDAEHGGHRVSGFSFKGAEARNQTAIYVAGTTAVRGAEVCYNNFYWWDVCFNASGDTSTGQCSFFHHNRVRMVNRAVYINGADHVEIHSNRLIDCRTDLIKIGDSGTYTIWIHHNNCAQPKLDDDSRVGGDGFVIDRGINVNITNNHIEMLSAVAGKKAIKLGKVDKYIVQANITNNFLNFDTTAAGDWGQEYAIELLGHVYGLRVEGNEFHGMGGNVAIAGIKADGLQSSFNFHIGQNLIYGTSTKPVINDDTYCHFLDAGRYNVNTGIELIKFWKSTNAPNTLRNGQLRYADGTAWNPGNGEGFYGYWGSAWHLLGGGLNNIVEDLTPQLGGNLDMNGKLIGGNSEAQLDDAVAKKHTAGSDTALGAQAENLDMNTHKVVGVVDPTANQEAATKKYVDDNSLGTYAEGNFTPVLKFAGGVTGITYSTQAGVYTKIGRVVTFTCLLQLTNKGSSVGFATVEDLPFISLDNNGNYTAVSIRIRNISFADYPQGIIVKNESRIRLEESTNAGVKTTLTDANFANDSGLTISGSYMAA